MKFDYHAKRKTNSRRSELKIEDSKITKNAKITIENYESNESNRDESEVRLSSMAQNEFATIRIENHERNDELVRKWQNCNKLGTYELLVKTG